MSQQTTSDVYEPVVACEIAINTANGESINWTNERCTEFEAPPGTKFWLSAYIMDKSEVWHQHRKLVDMKTAKQLVSVQNHFCIIKELLGNPDKLAVLYRHMYTDGAAQIGESYTDYGEQHGTENRSNI